MVCENYGENGIRNEKSTYRDNKQNRQLQAFCLANNSSPLDTKIFIQFILLDDSSNSPTFKFSQTVPLASNSCILKEKFLYR